MQADIATSDRRQFLQLMGLTGLSFMIPAGASSALAAAPGSGGTLRVGFFRDNTDLVSLDPFQVYWIEHRVVVRNIVESLTDQDPETGEIIPWLAESWDVGSDGLSYTFRLRKDVTFSDGTPFNAAAVKTAYDSNKAFAADVPATFGRTYLTGYDRAEIVDDYTVRLILSQRNAGFLQATSTTNLAVLAPASYAKSPEERSRGDIIGTGPFTLAEYTPEVRVRLKRRDDYAWPSKAMENPGAAYLDEVEILYIPEDSIRNGEFVQGNLDVVWPRDPFPDPDIGFLTSNGGRIVGRALPGAAYSQYPNTQPGRPFSDPKIRAAVQKAIDRETYAKGIFNAEVPAVEGPFETTTPFFKSQAQKLVYDPDGARALLDEAGWTVGDDGWRYKDGKRLTLVHIQRDVETPGDVLVQDQLRQVGIELKIRIVIRGDYPAVVATGDYDWANSYYSRADPVVWQTFLDRRFTNNAPFSINPYPEDVWPKVAALLDAGMEGATREERAKAYGDLQDLLIDENISFPIFERIWQAALSPQVQGFNWSAENLAFFSDVWLQKES